MTAVEWTGQAHEVGWHEAAYSEALGAVLELAEASQQLAGRMTYLPVCDPIDARAELRRLRALLDLAEARVAEGTGPA